MKKELQEILLGGHTIVDSVLPMYYLSKERPYKTENGLYYLKEKTQFDFSSYYNIFSLKKWKKYTGIEKVFLELEFSGELGIELLGYYIDDTGKTHKESFGCYYYKNTEKNAVYLDFPEHTISDVFAFKIITGSDPVFFGGGRYCADIKKDAVENKHITIISKCVRSNGYMEYNIASVYRDILSDDRYKERFEWIIFDNGSLSDNIDIKSDRIKVTPYDDLDDDISDILRKTKGINKKTSHVLLLDSDIQFDTVALKRLYDFLSVLKKEYKTTYIQAAMLDMNKRNIQQEDFGRTVMKETGIYDDNTFDLNVIKEVVRNECVSKKAQVDYIGWWMGCFPAEILDSDERTGAFSDCKESEMTGEDIIVLNGFCFWHKPYNNINSGALYIKEAEASVIINESEKETLQKLLFGKDAELDNNMEMFYRSSEMVSHEDGVAVLEKDCYYDFSTYFNSFSYEKWKKYTSVRKVYLELEASGDFTIELMGHYVDGGGFIHKEWLGKYEYDLFTRKKLVFEFSQDTRCDVLAFQIKTKTRKVCIYNGRYFTVIGEGKTNKPYIALATTTFKKERYMEENIKLLKKELFGDEEYKDKFKWIIVDNGSTLDKAGIEDDYISVFYNPNTGGSGGFTRGIIEANRLPEKPTHVVLMDDDVKFFAESFKRLYKLLLLLKDEYSGHFISGAMLEMEAKNIQHEDIGRTTPDGEHGPVKPCFDLNKWDSVIKNEVIPEADNHQYAGWWFCCIPTTIARNDNLPIPFFIRGDDIEYSIRNSAGFITMNGICIWHQGFGNKFSAAMEFYQVHRNDLILHALNPKVKGVSIIKRIKDLFWQEIYKFNYKGADLLLDAVEDYMKGPDFIASLDGEKCMKDKKEKDNMLLPMSFDIESRFDKETLYDDEPLSKMKRAIYDYSYNGQLFPVKGLNRKISVIPYGWGYWPGRQYMADTIYAVDTFFNVYAIFKKSGKKFKAITDRYKKIISDYNARKKEVAKAYRAEAGRLESIEFWEEYLK